jgi:hypothetical protein
MTAYSVLNVVLVKNLVEQAQFPVLAMSGYPANRSLVDAISEWFLARL